MIHKLIRNHDRWGCECPQLSHAGIMPQAQDALDSTTTGVLIRMSGEEDEGDQGYWSIREERKEANTRAKGQR